MAHEMLRSLYDDFMVTNNLMGYVMSLLGRVFLLPGGSLMTTQAHMSGGPQVASPDVILVIPMLNLFHVLPSALPHPKEDENDLPDLD